MPRWQWLRGRAHRLQTGTLEELRADIAYCEQRANLAKLKAGVKTWRNRRAEAEAAVIERFGEEALDSLVGNSRAWGKR